MILTIFIILLIINIIGLLNRKRAWAKIFMVSQILVVGGLVIMFNIQNSQRGIQGLEAKKKRELEKSKSIDDLKNIAKEKSAHSDTIDVEKNQQNGNKVQY